MTDPHTSEDTESGNGKSGNPPPGRPFGRVNWDRHVGTFVTLLGTTLIAGVLSAQIVSIESSLGNRLGEVNDRLINNNQQLAGLTGELGEVREEIGRVGGSVTVVSGAVTRMEQRLESLHRSNERLKGNLEANEDEIDLLQDTLRQPQRLYNSTNDNLPPQDPEQMGRVLNQVIALNMSLSGDFNFDRNIYEVAILKGRKVLKYDDQSTQIDALYGVALPVDISSIPPVFFDVSWQRVIVSGYANRVVYAYVGD